jgi:NAD(P)H-dependent FMN reductase
MITLICGTNRPDANTRKVARQIESMLAERGRDVTLLDLADLPRGLFDPSAYAEKPPEFGRFQEAILNCDGILAVIPEYNGSFPGVMKYFIDMLRFPDSLKGIPAAFVGVAAGEWGGLRAIEQLEMIFQYRSAHLYGKRLFLKKIHALLDEDGKLHDPALVDRLEAMVGGFLAFCDAVAARE